MINLEKTAMKLILAYVHPSHADRIVHALERAGLYQLSLTRVHGVVHPDEPIVRPDMGSVGSPETRIEAYCEDDRAESVVALIRETGHVGNLPSGVVFVHPVDQAWTIRKALPS